MRNHPLKELSKELQQAGASNAEVKELLPLAANLRLLNRTESEHKATDGWWQKILKPALFIVPSLAAGMVLIIISQTVLPTSWLYPVQKASDTAATAIHPQYKAAIMMKRAQQVNELVAMRANSDVILATLASYTNEARTYKSTDHTSYAAFEYCKSNLQQAAISASPSVRQAITGSLDSLNV